MGQPRMAARFIPAPAGNTLAGNWTLIRWAVHPRACGEHETRRDALRGVIGSSPRLRGTRYAETRRQVGERFIPAPAGNTAASDNVRWFTAVHPRACGEHSSCKDLI